MIVIVGLPASGKTTVGRSLASRLDVPFFDTDSIIEQTSGRSISQIFAEDGEQAFRSMESGVIREVLEKADGVASLGGGAVTTPDVRAMLVGHDVVWIDVDVPTLSARAQSDTTRPLLAGDTGGRMAQLDSERRELFDEVSTFRLDADSLTVDEEVDQILTRLMAHDPIRVSTDHPYDVHVVRGASSLVRDYVQGASRVGVICPHVMGHLAHDIAQVLPESVVIEIPEAEHAKTPDVLVRCWRALAQAGFTRNDAIIGLGGGSTTDLAGFVASTYVRGISYISMPTTVLGMADAAVGGKTGINLPEGKNLVGSFYEPQVVLCDLRVLDSLGGHDVVSGLSEVIKCGFIADRTILDIVSTNPSAVGDTHSPQFTDVLRRAIGVKAGVVSQDFRETGAGGGIGREALNYGHTLAHAIEKIEGFTWSHGDAVAVGMVFAAEVARRVGMIDHTLVDLHRRILSSVGLPVSYAGPTWETVRDAMRLDKKARGHHLRLVLLREMGDPVVTTDVDERVLAQAYSAIGEEQHVHP